MLEEEKAFVPIEGCLPLDEACEQLVHLAKCIQNTHTLESANSSALMMRDMFESRKTGLLVLLDLVEQYVYQIPAPHEQ